MKRLANAAELLDGPLDSRVLRGNLRDLARVNRWLGGVAVSREAVRILAHGLHRGPGATSRRSGAEQAPLTLLDVGTGFADIPEKLVEWGERSGLRLRVTAVDSRMEIVDAAYERLGERPDLHLDVVRGTRLPYPDGAFDIAHISMVLHHLEPQGAQALLDELTRVSRLGVIVNDLDRARRYWLGAWLLGHVFTRNRYTRHDGPLSVLRGYRPAEVAQLAARSGLVEVARRTSVFGHRYALAFVPAPSVSSGHGG